MATKKIIAKIQPKKSVVIQKKTAKVTAKIPPTSRAPSLTSIAKPKTQVTKKIAIPKPTTKNPRVRPSRAKDAEDLINKPGVVLTIPLMHEICGRIASGEPLYKICGTPGFPSRTEFYYKCGSDKDYAAIYNNSLVLRGERYADEITERADEARGKSSDDIQAIRLEVHTRQWVVSRLLPKKYGDRMIVAGDQENPLVTKMVLGASDLLKKIKGEKK